MDTRVVDGHGDENTVAAQPSLLPVPVACDTDADAVGSRVRDIGEMIVEIRGCCAIDTEVERVVVRIHTITADPYVIVAGFLELDLVVETAFALGGSRGVDTASIGSRQDPSVTARGSGGSTDPRARGPVIAGTWGIGIPVLRLDGDELLLGTGILLEGLVGQGRCRGTRGGDRDGYRGGIGATVSVTCRIRERVGTREACGRRIAERSVRVQRHRSALGRGTPGNRRDRQRIAVGIGVVGEDARVGLRLLCREADEVGGAVLRIRDVRVLRFDPEGGTGDRREAGLIDQPVGHVSSASATTDVQGASIGDERSAIRIGSYLRAVDVDGSRRTVPGTHDVVPAPR